MIWKKSGFIFLSILIVTTFAQAEDINLELEMPSHTFSPGMPCKLDLNIQNSGLAYNNAQLFIALTVGTGEYWFYPGWKHYPNDVDWLDITIPQFSESTLSILPEFEWPEGIGEFSGASFLAAVVYNNTLCSNVSEFDFGWCESARIESIEPSSGPPGKKVLIKGTGFNLNASNIRLYINDMDFPIFGKGIAEDGKDFVLFIIPPLSPDSYYFKLSFDGKESNSKQLTIEDIAPTGKPLGEVLNDIQNGMMIMTSTIKDNLIPDAAENGLIDSQNVNIYKSTIDRANQMFTLFYNEFQNMDEDNKKFLESIMVQNGVDEIFATMATAMQKYKERGPLEVAGSNLMLTLDLTSACLSALDTAWTAIDFASFVSTLLSGEVTLPAPAVSVGIHLTIKVIDHVIDGGLPTELKHIHIDGLSPYEYIHLEINEPQEFTIIGTFGSQETIMQATLEITIDSCLAEMGKWLPETVKAEIVRNILDVLSGMGLEGWMTFLGDEFTHIGSIPDFDLPLDFNWYAAPYDLGSLVGRTMFQGCAAPMVSLLNTFGGFFCSSGVTDTCSGCVDVEFNYEKMILKANGGGHHPNYDELHFRWYVYEPWLLGLELPNSDPSEHEVVYRFQINDSQTPIFVYIPPGTFQMGSPDDEMCREGDEGPVHTVTISHGFYMQATEVTQQQWVDVFGDNPSCYENCMQCPVEGVTWYDCCIYCNRLSLAERLTPCYYSDESYTTVFDGTPPVTSGSVYWKQDANGYRLPTEAEWEYACRAGTTTAYNSGANNTDCYEDSNLNPLGWYYYNSDDTGFGHKTHPVGLKQPNNRGLYDMHGNVWEWCWDWYNSDYYEISPSTDPIGPSSGLYRVRRGGSLGSIATDCRSANRSERFPEDRFGYLGFRLLRSNNL